MRFRPCIDIHNGQVKQIVGGSLKDEMTYAKENFVSKMDAGFYAQMYRDSKIYGGHVILLNQVDSEYYSDDVRQAQIAFRNFPNGLQIGGGITDSNALDFINVGASHVIVTSFVFKDGQISYDNLNKLVNVVGKEHLVLDLSCRKKGESYYIVTDRWQKFTEVTISDKILDELSIYCDEFLVHAVDVEGKAEGIEEKLVEILGNWGKIPITYAGGIASFEDLDKLYLLGKDKIDYTIGSALDIFGGKMKYNDVVNYRKEK